MKKISKLVFMLLSVLVFTVAITIDAGAKEVTTKSDDKNYNYTTVSEEITSISASTTHIRNHGYTTRNGTKYNQINDLFVLDYSKGEDVKVVSWAVQNYDGTGYLYRTIKSIGEDYEKNHPGYIVLCGINSDQYYMKFGTRLLEDSTDYYRPQTVYPMVADGENWFVIGTYKDTYINNTVGFKNDGSSIALEYGARSVKGFYIHIYNEQKEEIGMYEIDDLNMMNELGENQTTLISSYRISDTTYQTMSKQSNNDFYVVEKADNCYVNNTVEYAFYKNENAMNSFFGKGTISKISKSVELTKNQFAIETTNEALKKALNVGTYVKCQYEFDDGFANIKESTGFHCVQRFNGVDYPVDNPYNSRPYPRSIVGCDDQGKVYMITCNGKNSAPTEGMWAQESNAMMKQYGIINAFQMDGGGSVTCVIRNEQGELEYAMPSVEGEYREDLCGIFIVMKVTDADITLDSVSQEEAKFQIDLSRVTEKYTNAYVKVKEVGGKVVGYYKIENGISNVTGLKSRTDYSYLLTLENESGEKRDTFVMGGFKTYALYPVVSQVNIIKNEETNTFDLTVHYEDTHQILQKMVAIINGKSYRMKHENGVATLSLDASTNSILDLQIEIQCQPLQKILSIEGTNYTIDATPAVFFSNAVTTVSSWLDEFFK